jgi:hypothetical protein
VKTVFVPVKIRSVAAGARSVGNNLKCLKGKRSGKYLTSRSIKDEDIKNALHEA